MPLLSKEEMITQLTELAVDVPSTASLSQLRTLHAEVMEQQRTTAITSIDSDAAQATVSGNTTNAPILETDAALQRQIQMLKQQKELLLLQKEVKDLQVAMAPTPVFDAVYIDSMVNCFSGDDNYDVNKWVSDLEDAFETLRLDERSKFVATRRLLTGTAKIFMRTVSTYQYDDLKHLLLNEFGRTITTQEIYTQLRNRRVRPNESIKRYIIEMQETASRATIPETEVVDFIIAGLRHAIPDTSMLYTATNVGELKNLIERYERIRRCAPPRTSTNTRPSVPTPAVVNRHTTATSNPMATNNSATQPDVRCFNCSKYGHFQSQCPKPQRPAGSCFKCGGLEHVYRNCPHRLMPSSTSAPAVAAISSEPAASAAAAITAVPGVENEDFGYDVTSDRIKSIQNVSVAFMTNDSVDRRHLHILSLFDSGSPKSFINEEILPCKSERCYYPSGYASIGNHPLMTPGVIICHIKFREIEVPHEFIILPRKSCSYPLIIGQDLLPKLKIYLCYISCKYTKEALHELNKTNYELNCQVSAAIESLGINKCCKSDIDLVKQLCPELPMPGSDSDIPLPMSKPVLIETDATTSAFSQLCAIEHDTLSPSLNIGPQLDKEQTEEVLKVIKFNYYKFLPEDVEESEFKMKINLTHDTPIFSRPRRLSYYDRIQVQEIVNDLVERKIIRPSNSPYASAIVLVKKKNGKLRKCVDYRPLNKITVRDNYPLPRIDDCLEHLGGKCIFSLIDLRSGFHQIKMVEESIKYTAFVTPDGQWEYIRMPFGLKNAPQEFQRFINMILRPLISKRALVVYLDDILIASDSYNAHLNTLIEVLRTLRKHGLEIQAEKCKFAFKEIEYLGYTANSKGIRPNETHLQAIKNYPIPKDRHQLQRCLGLLSYFRRFVNSFSTIAKPMTNLLRKDSPFNFDSTCTQSFKILQQKLLEAPILCIYDPKKETELHCDASTSGFGAALLQKQDDNKFHPVAFYSKTTSVDESKLHSYELETLSVIYALKRFHTYVHGIPFKIVTDNQSLAKTLQNQSYSAKIARWALFLENYSYEIRHRPGSSMSHVDALSRVNAAICEERDLDLQLQVAQCCDPVIKHLRSKLEAGSVKGFELIDGLVFRITPAGTSQLYVPKDMINNVIRNIHEQIGHLGIDKTYAQIKKNYWFPQLKNRIENFIKNCLKCIIYSAPARSNQQNLHHVPKAHVPFDTVHIDHLGPLPSLQSKKKYILVIIDGFTKFTKLYATTTTNTKEVCSALRQYFSYYSRPKRIVSDRATCFTSTEFTKFLEDNNIKHILNATASPQANGQVERVNRVLKPMLSKVSNPLDYTDWCDYIYAIEYALNNAVHSTTQVTPAILLFGVEQRGKAVDEVTEYLEDKNPKQLVDFRTLRQQASDYITKSQETNLKYFLERHSSAPQFEEGDHVVIRNKDTTADLNKKLLPKFKGPYVIYKKLPHDRYVVKDIEGFQVTQMPYTGILEANKLKKWIS